MRMQETGWRIRMVFAFSELTTQWRGQEHQNEPWPSVLSTTGRDRQRCLPAFSPPCWFSSLRSAQALEPALANSYGPSKVGLWNNLHLPPGPAGALSSHVWSPTAVRFLCCELAAWEGCRKEQEAGQPTVFQLCQHRCQTREKPRWEPPSWAPSTQRTMQDPPPPLPLQISTEV